MAGSSNKNKTFPVRTGRRSLAFAVHLFTASGAAVALFALLAAIAGEFTVMFALLGLALLIDGVDGALARKLQVAQLLPRWSGEVLDHVVDYLTYVFVPVVALVTGAIFPPSLAYPAAAAILISSAIYFADRNMKTGDGYFRGFPGVWNIAIFYLFLLRPDPLVAFLAVAVLVVLTFAPIHFVHPFQMQRWAAVNVILLLGWSFLAAYALYHFLIPPPWVVYALVGIAVCYVAAGLLRRPSAS